MGKAAAVLAVVILVAACSATTLPAPQTQPAEQVRDDGDCTPVTCASAGANCGRIPDGCGALLECGTCAEGLTCGAAGPNQCGEGQCSPKSCGDYGATCGDVSDGCGGIRTCGVCVDGEACAANTCTCVPKRCSALDATCGALADGCGGILNCGTCPSGESCGGGGPNRCGALSCRPTTCASAGAVCGVINDGCGSTANCGSCAAGQECRANQCVVKCTPTTCAQNGWQCGFADDGCGGVLNCGECAVGMRCSNIRACEPVNPPKPTCATMTATGERFEVEVHTLPSRATRPPGDPATIFEYELIAWQAPRTADFVIDTATSVGVRHLWVVDDCDGNGSRIGEGAHGPVRVNAQAGRWYLIAVGHMGGQDYSGRTYVHGSPREPSESTCSDFADNDGDGTVNCADPDCAGDTACAGPACLATEPPSVLPFVHHGSTVGKRNIVTTNGRWSDDVISFTAPKSGTFAFTLSGSYRQLSILRGCSGYTLASDGGAWAVTPAVAFPMTAGQRVLIATSAADEIQVPADISYELRIEERPTSEVGRCGDGHDNDVDGASDADDPDCQPTSP